MRNFTFDRPEFFTWLEPNEFFYEVAGSLLLEKLALGVRIHSFVALSLLEDFFDLHLGIGLLPLKSLFFLHYAARALPIKLIRFAVVMG